MLRRELGDVEPLFVVAMADASLAGPAKQLLEGLARLGIDLDDEKAVDQAVRRLGAGSALPYDDKPEDLCADDVDWDDDAEEESVVEERLAARELPVVRLAPMAELAADVRATHCFMALDALVRFAPGRTLTARQVLRRADAHEVVHSIDLGLTPQEREAAQAARSALDIGPLARLWRLAREFGLLGIDRGRAIRGTGAAILDGAGDEALLALWRREADAALPGAYDLAARYPGFASPVDTVALDFLIDRYAGDPVGSLEALRDAGVEREQKQWGDGGYPMPDTVTQLVRDLVDSRVRRWEWVGLVKRSDDAIRLTRLGRYGVNAAIREHGGDAPTLREPLGETPVDDILEVALRGDDMSEDLVAEWVAAVGPDHAAGDLLAWARHGNATERSIVFDVLHLCGDAAVRVAREALNEPTLHAHAAVWLTARGIPGVVAGQAEAAWILVDLIGPHVGGPDEGEVVRNLLLTDDEVAEQVVAAMPRCDHPSTLAVLEAVGRYAADKRLAKAARRAAFKLRSRAPALGR
jgi:hypothetical protein